MACAAARVYRIFFFQAEDGIRDRNVTGVQTCALPILDIQAGERVVAAHDDPLTGLDVQPDDVLHRLSVSPYVRGEHMFYTRPVTETLFELRSEERRVGKDERYGIDRETGAIKGWHSDE